MADVKPPFHVLNSIETYVITDFLSEFYQDYSGENRRMKSLVVRVCWECTYDWVYVCIYLGAQSAARIWWWFLLCLGNGVRNIPITGFDLLQHVS